MSGCRGGVADSLTIASITTARCTPVPASSSPIGPPWLIITPTPRTSRHKSLCGSGRIDLIVAASLLPIPITAEAGHELIIEVVDNGAGVADKAARSGVANVHVGWLP